MRLTSVGVIVVGADWALGQRESAAPLPTVDSMRLAVESPRPRTLELISATVVEPAEAMERMHATHAAQLNPPPQSSGIRFAHDTAAMIGNTDDVLDRVAGLLSRHTEATTVVRVTGREYSDPARDRILKRERGRAVIAALVERGMSFSSISIETDSSDAPVGGTHRVSLDVDIGNQEGG